MKEHGFREFAHWTGPGVAAAVLEPVEFPALLDPKDDLPPATLITSIRRDGAGKLLLRGVAHDDNTIATVSVNGTMARITSQHAGVADWEATVPDAAGVTARSRDAAGNEERWAHVMAAPQK
jgi:hypothetical protein